LTAPTEPELGPTKKKTEERKLHGKQWQTIFMHLCKKQTVHRHPTPLTPVRPLVGSCQKSHTRILCFPQTPSHYVLLSKNWRTELFMCGRQTKEKYFLKNTTKIF